MMDKLPIVERLRELADDYNEETTEKAADLIEALVAALDSISNDANTALRHHAENCQIVGYGVLESARAALVKAKS